jgi:hypothetical protein
LFPLLLQFESPALSGIVPALDIVKDIRSCLGSRPVVVSIHPFSFEHADEARGRCVIRTAPHRTHAADDLVCFQEPLVFLGRKLAALDPSAEQPACGLAAATPPSTPPG